MLSNQKRTLKRRLIYDFLVFQLFLLIKAKRFMKTNGLTGVKNPNPLYKKVRNELILNKCQLKILEDQKCKNRRKHAFSSIKSTDFRRKLINL